MSDCRKIEADLWRYDELSQADRRAINLHISKCASCQSIWGTIQAIKASALENTKQVEKIDTATFDAEVFRKIRSQRHGLPRPEYEPRRYAFRVALSFGMAALAVLVLFKSVSDLQDLGLPRQAKEKVEQESDQYGLIHVELKPPETPKEEQKKDMESPMDRSAAATKPVPQPKPTTAQPAPPMTFSAERSRAEMPLSVPSADTAQKKPEDVFSILTAPVTSPSPESVNIGAIFVTDRNISIAQQSRAASLAEVYNDTGAMQAFRPQSSVLVTVEKMPEALKMGMPEYPVWARKQGLSGTVWIRARVDAAGRVSEAEAISCDIRGAGFEEAAVKAAKSSLFVPASSNGINLPVWIVYPVKFIYKR